MSPSQIRFYAYLVSVALLGTGCSSPTKPNSAETQEVAAETTPPEPSVAASKPIELEPLPEMEGDVGGTFSIAQVMQLAHKNKLYRELFQDDFAPAVGERLLLLYTSLPKQGSPKGDAEDWVKRSTSLANAARKVIEGGQGGVAEFKRAVNCNSCHSRHKP